MMKTAMIISQYKTLMTKTPSFVLRAITASRFILLCMIPYHRFKYSHLCSSPVNDTISNIYQFRLGSEDVEHIYGFIEKYILSGRYCKNTVSGDRKSDPLCIFAVCPFYAAKRLLPLLRHRKLNERFQNRVKERFP